MAEPSKDMYMEILALVMAAVILLIMISITEAAASHERLMGNPHGNGQPWTVTGPSVGQERRVSFFITIQPEVPLREVPQGSTPGKIIDRLAPAR